MSETAKPKGGNNFLKILIIVLLIAILVGGAAFGGYIIASKEKTSSSGTQSVSTSVDSITEAYYEVDNDQGFLVNLADTDSKRYLKVKIVYAYNSKTKKVGTELKDKQDVISDCVISVVRTKTAADLNGTGADKLKKELVERINSVLTEGKLTNIYYTDFLVQ